MEFKHMEIKDFKKKYNIDVLEGYKYKESFYDFLLNTIDNCDNISYFSASFEEEDVLHDINEENPNLNLELIEIENVYIALY